jgi:hypothetical protein
MVDGLDGEKTASWEGGDFATIVHQLKMLGFNAVRLPFLFGNLYTLPAQVRLGQHAQLRLARKGTKAQVAAITIQCPAGSEVVCTACAIALERQHSTAKQGLMWYMMGLGQRYQQTPFSGSTSVPLLPVGLLQAVP